MKETKFQLSKCIVKYIIAALTMCLVAILILTVFVGRTELVATYSKL